jgi:hypothetical protein
MSFNSWKFDNFLRSIREFLASRGGQMLLAMIIYFSAVGMVEKGHANVGEKIAYMALGAIFQSMSNGGSGSKPEPPKQETK